MGQKINRLSSDQDQNQDPILQKDQGYLPVPEGTRKFISSTSLNFSPKKRLPSHCFLSTGAPVTLIEGPFHDSGS